MSRDNSVVVLASGRARHPTGRGRSSCASVGSASCLCHHRHGLESRALGAVQARLNGESAMHLIWANQDDCEDKQLSQISHHIQNLCPVGSTPA